MRTSNHIKTILLEMLEREQVTAAQFLISNANVYFNQLAKMGICKGVWNKKHTHKWWYITDYDKAQRYLESRASTDNDFCPATVES